MKRSILWILSSIYTSRWNVSGQIALWSDHIWVQIVFSSLGERSDLGLLFNYFRLTQFRSALYARHFEGLVHHWSFKSTLNLLLILLHGFLQPRVRDRRSPRSIYLAFKFVFINARDFWIQIVSLRLHQVVLMLYIVDKHIVYGRRLVLLNRCSIILPYFLASILIFTGIWIVNPNL